MKRGYIAGIFLFVLLISLGLVAAQDAVESIKEFGKDIFEVAKPLVEALLGSTPEEELLFAKFLLLVIVLSIVWLALDKVEIFQGRPWILAVVSIAVSVLSIRFLGESEWIQTIILPYSALGVAITAFLPLLIYFYFVYNVVQTRVMRKVAWIFAAVVFIGLWFSRLDDIGASAGGITPAYIYLFAALGCIICFTLDGTFKRFFAKIKAEKTLSPVKYTTYNKYLTQIEDLIDSQKRFGVNSREYRSISAQIKDLEKKAEDILAGR